MNRTAFICTVLCLLITSCKEQKMIIEEAFSPAPVTIPFTKGHVFHIFPVLKEKSIGIVCGERWAIGTIKKDAVNLDDFPEKEFSIPSAKALPQKDEEVLFVRTPKSIDILNWKEKKQKAYFMDISKSLGVGIENSKVIDYKDGIALSVFYYDDDNMDFHYSFVIDDIPNKKRLKDIPILDYAPQFAVYFTPSCIFYRRNWQVPWQALDNKLNEISHPLVNILNKDPSDSTFAVVNDNMFISEELKQALIISFSKVAGKDMLFLARWYAEPEVIPIPIDSLVVSGNRRLMKTPNQNTISPSGKWVYFATDGGEHLEDTHYLIYLDPALPNGFLPPFKLSIEGNVEQASWMTTPEGLVLYKDDSLLYFDLSNFKPQDYMPGH